MQRHVARIPQIEARCRNQETALEAARSALALLEERLQSEMAGRRLVCTTSSDSSAVTSMGAHVSHMMIFMSGIWNCSTESAGRIVVPSDWSPHSLGLEREGEGSCGEGQASHHAAGEG